MRRKTISPELHQAIVNAERAAQYAHNLAYAEKAPYWLKIHLGQAQDKLIHNVVKYSGRTK